MGHLSAWGYVVPESQLHLRDRFSVLNLIEFRGKFSQMNPTYHHKCTFLSHRKLFFREPKLAVNESDLPPRWLTP